MYNDDLIRPHQQNSSNSSSPVANQEAATTTATVDTSNQVNQITSTTATTTATDTFSYPSSPKPTRVSISQPITENRITEDTSSLSSSFHETITLTTLPKKKHATPRKVPLAHRKNRNLNRLLHPQNRLLFINALKTAWSIQTHHLNNDTRNKSTRLSSIKDTRDQKRKKVQLCEDTTFSMRPQKEKLKQPHPLRQQTLPNSIRNSNSDISIVKKKLDFPPITADALSELSVYQLFKSLQIRHDLLLDRKLTFRPNLNQDKNQESDTYWIHLDDLIQRCSVSRLEDSDEHYQLIFLVRNLLTELSQILISLIDPFPQINTSISTTSIIWNWPDHVTEQTILSVLDPDLVHQQLSQGCLDVNYKFRFLDSMLSPLCPKEAEKIQRAVDDEEYAKALKLCFLALEAIKLDCANKALHYYRPYLIETGTTLEWEFFFKQLDNGEVNITSVSDWMANTWTTLGPEAKFINVFRTGILNLITDDNDIISALNLTPLSSFPITFCYDEKRFNRQMRHEFQNIIVIGILLMPYRLMAGKKARISDIQQLKSTYSKLLKDASIANGRVSCFHLALHACNTANKIVSYNQDIAEQAKYWSKWMSQNLRCTSPVYQVMYKRVRSTIIDIMAQPLNEDERSTQDLCSTTHATIGLEKEITKFGRKLSLIADYNLRTFGSLYSYLLPSVRCKITPQQ